MAKVQLIDDTGEAPGDLDGAARKVVLKALKKLESEPAQRGAPPGNHPDSKLAGFRKLVVGDRDYRIVYRVERGIVVIVWVIGKRAVSVRDDMAKSRLATYRNDRDLMESLQTMIDTVWAVTTNSH